MRVEIRFLGNHLTLCLSLLVTKCFADVSSKAGTCVCWGGREGEEKGQNQSELEEAEFGIPVGCTPFLHQCLLLYKPEEFRFL